MFVFFLSIVSAVGLQKGRHSSEQVVKLVGVLTIKVERFTHGNCFYLQQLRLPV